MALSKKRTGQQNAAMHKYFDLKADALNEAGYTLEDLGDVIVPATPNMVQRFLWNQRYGEVERVTPLHKQCFQFIADIFVDFGIDFRIALPDGTRVEFDPTTVKECIWRSAQKWLLKKESSTDLTVGEVTDVHKTCERMCAIKFPDCAVIPFPNDDRTIDYPDDDIDPNDIPF